MTITGVPHPPGKAWGVLALAFALVPLPFLVMLNVLSAVVRSAPEGDPAFIPAQWIYGIIAVLGLLFFTVFYLAAIILGVSAVSRPRVAGKVLGWSAIAVVIASMPFIWLGYLVWTAPGAGG
ncbi:MAG: hypothetical protein U1E32_05545 [Rhodoglobus sp.]|jgi:hypothetical protein|nr:hypothetical protein [Rhodoglobus sp.]